MQQHSITKISNELAYEGSSNVDYNNSHIVKLSRFRTSLDKTKIFFPSYFLEDYFSEIVDRVHVCKEEDEAFVLSSEVSLTQLESLIRQAYSATVWYPALAEVTFASVLVPISSEEHKQLTASSPSYPESLLSKLDDAMQRLSKTTSKDKVKDNNKKKEKKDEDEDEDEDEEEEEEEEEGDGFFVKLDDVSSHKLDHGLRTPMEVIYELTSNERTAGALTPHSQIFLRVFDRRIKREFEFRCFVHKLKLRAISQYFCYDYFECLQGREEFFKKLIVEFFNKEVKDKLPYTDATVDVVVIFEGEEEEGDKHQKKKAIVKVVEVNEFGAEMWVGSALFSWEKDYETIYHSKEPVLRIRTHPTVLL